MGGRLQTKLYVEQHFPLAVTLVTPGPSCFAAFLSLTISVLAQFLSAWRPYLRQSLFSTSIMQSDSTKLNMLHALLACKGWALPVSNLNHSGYLCNYFSLIFKKKICGLLVRTVLLAGSEGRRRRVTLAQLRWWKEAEFTIDSCSSATWPGPALGESHMQMNVFAPSQCGLAAVAEPESTERSHRLRANHEHVHVWVKHVDDTVLHEWVLSAKALRRVKMIH